jgi:hypothetical protein
MRPGFAANPMLEKALLEMRKLLERELEKHGLLPGMSPEEKNMVVNQLAKQLVNLKKQSPNLVNNLFKQNSAMLLLLVTNIMANKNPELLKKQNPEFLNLINKLPELLMKPQNEFKNREQVETLKLVTLAFAKMMQKASEENSSTPTLLEKMSKEFKLNATALARLEAKFEERKSEIKDAKPEMKAPKELRDEKNPSPPLGANAAFSKMVLTLAQQANVEYFGSDPQTGMFAKTINTITDALNNQGIVDPNEVLEKDPLSLTERKEDKLALSINVDAEDKDDKVLLDGESLSAERANKEESRHDHKEQTQVPGETKKSNWPPKLKMPGAQDD